jgi:hypothetical protein
MQCSVKDPSVLIRGLAQSSWGPMSKGFLDSASGRIKWRMEKHSTLHHPTCCSLEYFQQYLLYCLTLDHRVLCAEITYSVAHECNPNPKAAGSLIIAKFSFSLTDCH